MSATPPAHPVGTDGASSNAPRAAASRTPLCAIVDEESSIRHFVSLILQGTGIDTMEFADGAAFRAARPPQPPDIVFLNINLDAADAIQTLEMLGRAGYAGAVQLMSNRGAAVLESLRQAGERNGLRMLSVLKKPFETSAIQKIVGERKLGYGQHASAKVSLGEALANKWVEFWYQPKVDVRRKQLAGAELFARVIHPAHGILLPGNFMPDADEASLQTLAERALVDALQTGIKLEAIGLNLRMAVNMSLAALEKLPVADIVRTHRPNAATWPGLIIDIPEDQVVQHIPAACDLARKHVASNVRLAIDDFGRAFTALTNVNELPFAEMKLERSLVAGCATDKAKAPVCKTLIDLAHSYGSQAVGIGIEKASALTALVTMGCNLGQGFLLGQPMPEERFISLLKQRAGIRPAATANANPAFAAAS